MFVALFHKAAAKLILFFHIRKSFAKKNANPVGILNQNGTICCDVFIFSSKNLAISKKSITFAADLQKYNV